MRPEAASTLRPKVKWRLREAVAVCCCALATIVFPIRSAAQDAAAGQSAGDPVPLQRIIIPPSRLPAELERVRQGVLVQMPRDEFEELVRRAGRSPRGPRLAK